MLHCRQSLRFWFEQLDCSFSTTAALWQISHGQRSMESHQLAIVRHPNTPAPPDDIAQPGGADPEEPHTGSSGS
jgi:hypothetical protein